MSGTIEKANFLRNKFIPMLTTISPVTVPNWGKMNLHQMIEHMSYSFRQANGREEYTIMTPEEQIPRMQAFLESDKPFRENTPNQLLPDDPEPPRTASIPLALEELKGEIEHFFDVFRAHPDKKITNPFFGTLHYEQWVKLLYKHAWHHLRQFGVQG
ncbi:MAG TPA: DinB family protein [Flavipsychrobacter sp.]